MLLNEKCKIATILFDFLPTSHFPFRLNSLGNDSSFVVEFRFRVRNIF